MKLSPLRIVLLCLASGLCSALAIPLLPRSSGMPTFAPGIFFGVFLLIWLPTVCKFPLWKRVLLVLASGAICFSAIYVAVMIVGSKFRFPSLGFAAAGLLGASLLHLMLVLSGAGGRSWSMAAATALLGALLGPLFQFEAKLDSELLETLLYGLNFSAWQAAVGLLLFKNALQAAARS